MSEEPVRIEDPEHTSYDDPEDLFDDPEQEQADLEQRTALTEAVDDGASELEALAAHQLTDALTQRVSDAATKPVDNPLEVTRTETKAETRLGNLQGQVDRALNGLGASVGAQDFLSILFGFDTSTLPRSARTAGALTLLTHIVYAATGEPLMMTSNSNAADTVTDLTEKLNAMTDRAYWRTLSDFYSGTSTPTAELGKQLVFMGLTAELNPMTETFTWPTSDAKALAVDELLAAASKGKGSPVDLAGLYRRAATLTMNGTSVPRAITAELVRMAIADLSLGNHPSVGRFETPNTDNIKTSLAAETPPSDPAEQKAAQDRNDARTSARALLPGSGAAKQVGGTAQQETLRTTMRASRGYLGDMLTYHADRIVDLVGRTPGGSKASGQLDTIVSISQLGDAVDAWSAAYRSSTTDPETLRGLLDTVASRAKLVDSALRTTFGSMTDPAQNLAQSFSWVVGACTSEIAFEASELLGTDVKTTCDLTAAAVTYVEEATIRGRNRVAAQLARDSKVGLGDYIHKVGDGYETKGWYADLKNAGTAWSTADTRDLSSLGKATAAFAVATQKVAAAVEQLPANAAAEAATARSILDAMTEAVIDRLQRLKATDPAGTSGALPDKLVQTLRSGLSTPKPPNNLADYWRTSKKGVRGKLRGDLDSALAKKLKAFQKTAGQSPDARARAALDSAKVIEGYRYQVELTAKEPQKTQLLVALDNLLVAISLRLGTTS